MHDWGGAIGLSSFKDQSERINKIVIMNTAHFHLMMYPKEFTMSYSNFGAFIVRFLNGFARLASIMAVNKSMESKLKKACFHTAVGKSYLAIC